MLHDIQYQWCGDGAQKSERRWNCPAEDEGVDVGVDVDVAVGVDVE